MANILQVIWDRLYSTSSAMDGATLYQLRNVINRRNVTKDPTKNVAACDEFFSLVAEAHILAAAMKVFGMNSLDSTPSCELFPQECIALSSQERRKVLMSAAHKVLDQFVDISFGSSAAETPPSQDHVNEYACDVMTFGLFKMEFTDAIREADGTRILRCWKYFMLIFREAKQRIMPLKLSQCLLNRSSFLAFECPSNCCGAEQLMRMADQGKTSLVIFTWSI